MAQAYRVWTGTVIECTRPWGRTRAYVQVMRVTMAVVPSCVLQCLVLQRRRKGAKDGKEECGRAHSATAETISIYRIQLAPGRISAWMKLLVKRRMDGQQL